MIEICATNFNPPQSINNPMAAAGGAGAAAPPAQADNGGAPIHPDLDYNDYMEAFCSYLFDGTRDIDYYRYKSEVHDPMLNELSATGISTDELLKVHRKYVKHFFGNDPKGAQQALKNFLAWLTYGDTLERRRLGELWHSDGPESVRPFIQVYLDNGAKLEPLRKFINNIGYDVNNNDESDNKLELKVALLEYLEAERKAAPAEAALPLLPPSPPNSPPNSNNNNQGGGRRRKSRKLIRKTRRTTRRRNY